MSGSNKLCTKHVIYNKMSKVAFELFDYLSFSRKWFVQWFLLIVVMTVKLKMLNILDVQNMLKYILIEKRKEKSRKSRTNTCT